MSPPPPDRGCPNPPDAAGAARQRACHSRRSGKRPGCGRQPCTCCLPRPGRWRRCRNPARGTRCGGHRPSRQLRQGRALRHGRQFRDPWREEGSRRGPRATSSGRRQRRNIPPRYAGRNGRHHSGSPQAAPRCLLALAWAARFPSGAFRSRSRPRRAWCVSRLKGVDRGIAPGGTGSSAASRGRSKLADHCGDERPAEAAPAERSRPVQPFLRTSGFVTRTGFPSRKPSAFSIIWE